MRLIRVNPPNGGGGNGVGDAKRPVRILSSRVATHSNCGKCGKGNGGARASPWYRYIVVRGETWREDILPKEPRNFQQTLLSLDRGGADQQVFGGESPPAI